MKKVHQIYLPNYASIRANCKRYEEQATNPSRLLCCCGLSVATMVSPDNIFERMKAENSVAGRSPRKEPPEVSAVSYSSCDPPALQRLSELNTKWTSGNDKQHLTSALRPRCFIRVRNSRIDLSFRYTDGPDQNPDTAWLASCASSVSAGGCVQGCWLHEAAHTQPAPSAAEPHTSRTDDGCPTTTTEEREDGKREDIGRFTVNCFNTPAAAAMFPEHTDNSY
ncbi:hypothetical protein Q9966_000933 [Columba livia]|nr:hypothetical protein Q9966_000933 [Columba livia]